MLPPLAASEAPPLPHQQAPPCTRARAMPSSPHVRPQERKSTPCQLSWTAHEDRESSSPARRLRPAANPSLRKYPPHHRHDRHAQHDQGQMHRRKRQRALPQATLPECPHPPALPSRSPATAAAADPSAAPLSAISEKSQRPTPLSYQSRRMRSQSDPRQSSQSGQCPHRAPAKTHPGARPQASDTTSLRSRSARDLTFLQRLSAFSDLG